MAVRTLKYPLEITDEQVVETWEGVTPLTVQFQTDVPMLWVIADDESPEYKLHIVCIGTGNPIEEEVLGYLSTTQYDGNVWHWFFIPQRRKHVGR